jgi:hypothetical protein
VQVSFPMLKRMTPTLVALFCALVFPALHAQSADAFTPGVALGEGAMPCVAIDAANNVHLAYARDGALRYRIGTLGGKFGPEEQILGGKSLHDPRIAIDGANRPHVVVSDGHTKNRFTFYTNRIGGAWKPPLAVFDRDRENLNRATMPTVLLDADNTAIVGVFTVGDSAGIDPQWGALARLRNLDSEPTVAVRRKIDVWNPQVLLRAGEIWVGGRNKVRGGRRFTFQRHDAETLQEMGSPIKISSRVQGEAGRASTGPSGDLHAAGSVGAVSPPERGWYNTLSRVEKGLGAIPYKTSLENPCGMGMPVEDRDFPGRVYVFYWSDVSGDGEEHEHRRCKPREQLHFMRVEHGEKASELNRVTDRTGGHGPHFRLTPAAVAHPDGGALVVFRECAGGMFLTWIGEQ